MGSMETLRKNLKINTFLIFFVLGGFLFAASEYGFSPLVYARSGGTFDAPESFSRLAEMASPAVVNIRIVKTIQ